MDVRARTMDVNDATYRAWNAHDADAVAAVFAEDAVIREVGGAGEMRGRAAVRERAAALLTAFPDLAPRAPRAGHRRRPPRRPLGAQRHAPWPAVRHRAHRPSRPCRGRAPSPASAPTGWWSKTCTCRTSRG